MNDADNMTLRERLMLAYMEGIISLSTVLFFIQTWKIELLNNISKN